MTPTHAALDTDDVTSLPDAADDALRGTAVVRHTLRTISDSRWSYALVIVWAAVWRLLSAAIDHVPAYYYPDSWSYVVKSRNLSTLHPFHSPEVWRVWSQLIPGVPTERSVMVLQFGFGVAGAAILYHLLRRFGTSTWMLLLALLYGCLPLMIFADRSVLSESSTIFFWLLMTLGLVLVLDERHIAVRLLGAAGAGIAAGVAYSLRPATRYLVLTTVVLAAAAVLITLWRRHTPWSWRVAEAIGLCGVFVALALPVPMRLMSDNQAMWGTSTLTPGAGTVLAARWSIAIDCGPFDGLLPETQDALRQICQTPGERRDNSAIIWASGPFSATLHPGPHFGRIQAELTTVTRDAVLHHPGLAAANVLDRLRQFYFQQSNDIRQFHNGASWVNSANVQTHFKDHEHWFGGTQSRAPLTQYTVLQRWVERTRILPFLLTSALLVLLGRLAWLVARGDGWRRRLRTLLTQRGVLTLVVVLGTSAVGVATVAVGGVADFRYWAPILPSLMLSLGGAISLQDVALDTVERGTADDTTPTDTTPNDTTPTDTTPAQGTPAE